MRRFASLASRSVDRRPRLLLFVLGWFAALLLQPGDLGSVDAARRLQVTRWLWTDEPQVLAKDTATFGAPGRDGEYQAWYGVGQSLAFLPADVLARGAVQALAIDGENGRRAEETIVAVLVLPLVAAAGVVAAFALLLELGFARRPAFAGALSLLWCTTFLHYAQIGQENSLEFLLLAGGLAALLRWSRTGTHGSLAGGAFAIGYLMLVRLPHAVTVLAVSVFVAAEIHRGQPQNFRARTIQFMAVAVPVFAGYAMLDRLYQWFRFGSPLTTYVGICHGWRRQVDPSLPASFPFSTPFAEGFLGPIASIHKSVFLYDPLLAAALILFVACRAGSAARRFALTCAGLVAFNVVFFAPYFSWHGGSSWANRFTTVPVDLAAMLAIPTVLQWKGPSTGFMRRTTMALAAVALVIQLSSVFFWYNLEIAQTGDAAAPAHIARRPANIAQWIAGEKPRAEAGRKLSKRLRTPNFAPFLIAETVGQGPARVLQAAWLLGAFALMAASAAGFAVACGGFSLATGNDADEHASP